MSRRLILAAALGAAAVTVGASGRTATANMWGCNAKTVAASGTDYAWGSCWYEDSNPSDWARTQVLCSNASGTSRGWWAGGRVYRSGETSYAYCPSYQPIAKSAFVAVYP